MPNCQWKIEEKECGASNARLSNRTPTEKEHQVNPLLALETFYVCDHHFPEAKRRFPTLEISPILGDN
jgi:hypothetical protein